MRNRKVPNDRDMAKTSIWEYNSHDSFNGLIFSPGFLKADWLLFS